LKKYDGGVDWINLAQNRDNCWALVNIVMKIWVPYNIENFLTSPERVSPTKITDPKS